MADVVLVVLRRPEMAATLLHAAHADRNPHGRSAAERSCCP